MFGVLAYAAFVSANVKRSTVTITRTISQTKYTSTTSTLFTCTGETTIWRTVYPTVTKTTQVTATVTCQPPQPPPGPPKCGQAPSLWGWCDPGSICDGVKCIPTQLQCSWWDLGWCYNQQVCTRVYENDYYGYKCQTHWG